MRIPLTDEWIERYSQPGPRYTSYPTAVEFHDRITTDDYVEHLRRADAVDQPWSLYFHLPFCEDRCLFCACHTVITKHRDIAATYLKHLFREMELVASYLPNRRQISQLHLGGGTPTYYSPEQLRSLMHEVRRHFTFLPDAELAIEIDPVVTSKEHISTLVSEGFNRFSLGVQDTTPMVQHAVNRVQPVEQTEELLHHCRQQGITSINMDLICGLPHQTVETFSKTISQVIKWRPERLAVYSFAYVPWMKGHQKKLDDRDLPQARLRCEMQWMARDMLEDAGYLDIGMDHFALPEDPLALAQQAGNLRRNFMGYTVLPAPDWLGMGISAIGLVRNGFFQNVKKLSEYEDLINQGQLPIERGIVLQQDDLLRQSLIEQLMCNFSLSIPQIEATWAISFADYFAPEFQELRQLEQEGMLSLTRSALQVSAQGRLLIRRIASVFDRYLRQKNTDRPMFSKTL